jgi:glutamate-5-semialdehyde dehydrogenase
MPTGTVTNVDIVDHVEELSSIEPGMPIFLGGNRVGRASRELAEAFRPGDRLAVIADTGTILHIPLQASIAATDAVTRGIEAFDAMRTISPQQVEAFYLRFAANLEDDQVIGDVLDANAADVARATGLGRSTTRLAFNDRMRNDMISSLRSWAAMGSDAEIETVALHPGLTVEMVRSGLGVIGFVFEGRPNVFVDATGVLRSGNTVVLRIGSDAAQTAEAIMTLALAPALQHANLPTGAVSLLEAPSHATAWAGWDAGRADEIPEVDE